MVLYRYSTFTPKKGEPRKFRDSPFFIYIRWNPFRSENLWERATAIAHTAHYDFPHKHFHWEQFH